MTQCAISVNRLYKSVIEEVMTNVRDAFLDEGIDEQVLLEVKQTWEQKVAATRATDHNDTQATTAAGQQQPAGATQQLQQTAHQQVASGLSGQGSGGAAPAGAAPAPAPVQPQVSLVPVQITVPAQQAGGTAKTITIHVPSTALANGVAGVQLQAILSAPSAAATFAMEASEAADVIQRQLNTSLQRKGIALPPQLMQFINTPQVDGAAHLPDHNAHSARSSGGCCNGTRSKKLKRFRERQSFQLSASAAANNSSDEQSCSLGGEALHSSIVTAAGVNNSSSFNLQPQSVANDTSLAGCSLTSSLHDSTTAAGSADSGSGSSNAEHDPSARLRPVITVDRTIMDNIILNRLRQTQVDGCHGPIDDSSDEMSGDDDDDEDDKDEEDEKEKKFGEEEDEEDNAADANEDPLNSADDVSDDDTVESFDTDNVVVCQYDKITRARNRWKFNLKDGIMCLKGKDYVFLKATGEGEW
uniref:Transcription initiation factor IIA subunit 1-like n=1 Tax=Hirondellea gigas TaxID=1518452 RepID=A0A2P2I145_9CRUS